MSLYLPKIGAEFLSYKVLFVYFICISSAMLYMYIYIYMEEKLNEQSFGYYKFISAGCSIKRPNSFGSHHIEKRKIWAYSYSWFLDERKKKYLNNSIVEKQKILPMQETVTTSGRGVHGWCHVSFLIY